MSIMLREIDSKYVEILECFLVFRLEKTKRQPFPAKIIKCKIRRPNSNIINLKSEASIKRHREDKFSYQVISIHIFKNATYIITGCQMKSDLCNIYLILKNLLEKTLINRNEKI